MVDGRRSIPIEALDKSETEATTFPSWTRPVIAAGIALGILASLWTLRVAPLVWPQSLPVGWTIAGFAFLAALVGLISRYAFAKESLFFYNTFTGELIVVLLQDRPNRETVRSFVTRMKETARRRYEELKAEAERPSVGRELIALEGLREKRVISDEEFALKKDELLDEMMRD